MRREKKYSFIIAIIVISLLFSPTFSTPAESSDQEDIPARGPSLNSISPWPTPYGPTTLNSTVSHFSLKEFSFVEWALPIPDNIKGYSMSPPVIGPEDHIYFSFAQYLFCSNDTGSYQWFTRLENCNLTLSPPSIAPDGQVLVTTDLGHLVSFSSAGTILWDREVLNRSVEPILPVSNGTSIFYGIGNMIGCMDLTGKVIWNETLKGQDILYPPSLSTNGSIYFSWGRDLLCYSTNGEEKWNYRFGFETKSPPVIDRTGSIWVTSGGKYELRLDLIEYEGSLIFSEEVVGDLDPTTPVVLNNGNISLSPDGSSVLFFDHSGLIDSIPMQLTEPGYYYIDLTGKTIFMGYDKFYFEDGYDDLETGGRYEQLAFSNESIYFTHLGLKKISFDDIPHPSFSDGPIWDISIMEDKMKYIDPSEYFKITDSISIQYPYSFEVIDNDGLTISRRSNGSFSIEPGKDQNGEYQARITATGVFNHGNSETEVKTHSNWFKIIVVPVNDPPDILDRTLPPAYEASFYSTLIEAYDVDSDVSRLTYDSSGLFYMVGNRLEGNIPRGRGGGTINFKIYITDPEGAMVSLPMKLEILEKDEPPEIYVEEISMVEDEIERISIGNSRYDEVLIDDPDGYYDHEYELVLGPGLTLIERDDDDFTLLSEKNWYGETWFIFRLTDNTGTYEEKGLVSIQNEKDPVENLEIIILSDTDGITSNDMISLTVEYDDPDNGEFAVDFDWDSNISSWEYGQTDDHGQFQNRTLSPGYHLITVEVSKGYPYNDLDTTATIEIFVAGSVPTVTPGSFQVAEMEFLDDKKVLQKWITIHSLILLIIILAPILLFLGRTVYRKNREKRAIPVPTFKEVVK